MLGNVVKALKPNGRIGIVEFKKDGLGPGPPMEERRRPRAGDSRRQGRRTEAGVARELPSLPVHARVLAAMMPVPRFFADYQERVDAELRRLMPAGTERVGEAMAYTLLAPSKRVRPVLTLLTAELCGGETRQRAGCRVRRRNGPRLFADPRRSAVNGRCRAAPGPAGQSRGSGEAIAILAAFGLLDAAFGAIARGYEPVARDAATALVSDAIGGDGLIGGQAADLLATDQSISFEMLERIHRGKTGALFSAAATAGALTAGAPRDAIASLQAYAKNLGLGVSDHRRPARRRRRPGRSRESRCAKT